MKYSVALFFIAVASVPGQVANPGTPPARTAPAAPPVKVQPAGKPVAATPVKGWGSVANPGGPAPAKTTTTKGKTARGMVYAYPVYVPVYPSSFASQDAPPQEPTQPNSRPVVIQNYYGSQQPAQSSEALTTYQAPASTAFQEVPETAAPVSKATYYLIAYKDHHVYSAATYWLEGDTLHYVTTTDEHNQTPVSSLDLELTKRLNEGKDLGIKGSEQ